jgi:hypothetical protein
MMYFVRVYSHAIHCNLVQETFPYEEKNSNDESAHGQSSSKGHKITIILEDGVNRSRAKQKDHKDIGHFFRMSHMVKQRMPCIEIMTPIPIQDQDNQTNKK